MRLVVLVGALLASSEAFVPSSRLVTVHKPSLWASVQQNQNQPPDQQKRKDTNDDDASFFASSSPSKIGTTPLPYSEVTIGVLKESFEGECRVSQTPDSVRNLVEQGLTVLVEQGGE